MEGQWTSGSSIDTKAPKRKWGLRVLRCLTGAAARACETIDVNDLNFEGAEATIFERLEGRCAPERDAMLQRKFGEVVDMEVRSSKITMAQYTWQTWR